MLISLVVCTYNRADILKITLPSYLTLIIPKDVTVELIIVDNNSKDNTKDIINTFITKNTLDLKIKYLFEEKQGVSYARNTGFKNSKGDYIAYLDDECILPEQWLKIACQIIESDNPAFLGGPYLGKFMPGTRSIWYKESYGDIWLLQQSISNGPIKGFFLSGGNFFIRRDIFEKTGLFNTKLGMNGETVGYGEEPEFQQRFINKYPNEVTYYHSDLFVWHLIRDEKITIIGRFKDALARGMSQAELATKPSKALLIKSPFLLVYHSVKSVLSAIIKFPKSFFSSNHYFTLLHQDYDNNNWAEIGKSYHWSKLLLKVFNNNSKYQDNHSNEVLSTLQSIGCMLFGFIFQPFIQKKQREKLKNDPISFFQDSKTPFTRAVGKLLRII